MFVQALIIGIAAATPFARAEADVCSLPAEAGDCLAAFPRYAFNADSGECEFFTYGGCGGNGNNFETVDECEAACGRPGGDVCSLPAQSGPCLGAFPRYAFNSDSGECELFTYGGCLGNGNNFETIEKCEATCASPQPADPGPKHRSCSLQLEGGPCRGAFPRWGYTADRGCVRFTYGGCGGNRNRFDTKAQCEEACS